MESLFASKEIAVIKQLAPILILAAFLSARPVLGQSANPATASGGFVEVDGSKLYYEECGTGPDAVVLLHDGLANSAVWDGIWPAFCKRYHTIRYDRRGFGR